MKTRTILFGIAFVVFIGGLVLLQRFLQSGPDIIARRGIHWHPHLSVKIRGEEILIPANIGLAGAHFPVHTHDPDGIVHLEFSGVVREDDIRLKKFFEIWGKRFDRECILDSCVPGGHSLKMIVNGKENTEYGEYIMRDNDKIEIIYE